MALDADWLHHDHLDLEDLLNNAAAAARRQDWDTVERLVARLVQRLRGHMRLEEEVLFPAYEATPGVPVAPTEALRREHDALVNWCRDLHYSTQARNDEAFQGALQALKSLLAQHDEKEERFFLPMAGFILADRQQEILAHLETLDFKDPTGSPRVWGF